MGIHQVRRRLAADIGRVEAALLRGLQIALIVIQFDLLRALAIGRVGNRIVAIDLLSSRGLIHRLVLRRVDHYVVLTVRLVGIISTGCQKQQTAADPHFLRVGR